jgi:hypothetical protein
LTLVEPGKGVAPDLPPPVAATDPGRITLGAWAAKRLKLATSTRAPRFLVLSETFFTGWRAFVDGGEVPLLRANYLFRALVVPPGGAPR